MRTTVTRTSSAMLVQRTWRRRMVETAVRVRQWSRAMTRCVVCGDECATLFSCDNGHGCCLGCDASIVDHRCPVCRGARHPNANTTLTEVLVATRARHHCAACDVYVCTSGCEHHRAWCPSYTFTCPVTACHHMARVGTPLARHARRDHRVACVEVNRWFVVALDRMSRDVVVVLDGDDVVVVSTRTRATDTLHDVVTGGIVLGIRCYYRSAHSMALRCTVRQIRTSQAHQEDEYVEEFHVGIVQAMIASREHIIVSPYSPHIIPRCVDTSFSGLIDPLVLTTVTGPALATRLTEYGLRDIPLTTKPTKDTPPTGVPACVLRLFFERLSMPVGSVFVD